MYATEPSHPLHPTRPVLLSEPPLTQASLRSALHDEKAAWPCKERWRQPCLQDQLLVQMRRLHGCRNPSTKLRAMPSARETQHTIGLSQNICNNEQGYGWEGEGNRGGRLGPGPMEGPQGGATCNEFVKENDRGELGPGPIMIGSYL